MIAIFMDPSSLSRRHQMSKQTELGNKPSANAAGIVKIRCSHMSKPLVKTPFYLSEPVYLYLWHCYHPAPKSASPSALGS